MLSLNAFDSFVLPQDIQKAFAKDARQIRVEVHQWRRSTLAERSGVPESSIKRFENTGQVSLKSFLNIMFALGMLDRFKDLIKTDIEGMEMAKYTAMVERKSRSRGTK